MPFSQWIVDAQKHRKLLVVPARLGVALHPASAICSLLFHRSFGHTLQTFGLLFEVCFIVPTALWEYSDQQFSLKLMT